MKPVPSDLKEYKWIKDICKSVRGPYPKFKKFYQLDDLLEVYLEIWYEDSSSDFWLYKTLAHIHFALKLLACLIAGVLLPCLIELFGEQTLDGDRFGGPCPLVLFGTNKELRFDSPLSVTEFLRVSFLPLQQILFLDFQIFSTRYKPFIFC